MAKEAKKKNKKIDSKKIAVNNVSLQAKKGEIYGLLGPNGAGKTTTLRCIATLLKPTEGNISVCGHDTVGEAEAVRKTIGFLTTDIKLDPQFSPNYLFYFFGRLHGLTDEVIGQRKEELFSYFGITEFEDKKIEELSTGMRQKAAIAVSLVHNPEVVIFDEPTNGLDIVTARGVTDYLKKLKSEGKLVLISTHIMSEAEKLCDRIGIIISGEKVIDGTLEEILAATKGEDLEDAFFRLYQQYAKEETA
jgi:sodium transport system ATP-binding protein